VRYHFNEKFVAIVESYGDSSNAWVPVPVGNARITTASSPPPSAIAHLVECHYHQGNKNLCLFYSFASALFHLGYVKESEQVRMAGHGLEHHDRNSQIAHLRKTAVSLNIFVKNPLVWGQRKKRYRQFDIFGDISEYPTVVIPWGGDGGVQHAITIVGRYIFDSSYPKGLRLSDTSLDWCVNTKMGFLSVFFAIRFPFRLQSPITRSCGPATV
jgi:hypothetical protein